MSKYIGIEDYFRKSPILVFDATVCYTKDGEYCCEHLYDVLLADFSYLSATVGFLKSAVNDTIELKITEPREIRKNY